VKLLVLVSNPRSQVAIHSFHGLVSERKGAIAPTLTGHLQFVELQIEIFI